MRTELTLIAALLSGCAVPGRAPSCDCPSPQQSAMRAHAMEPRAMDASSTLSARLALVETRLNNLATPEPLITWNEVLCKGGSLGQGRQHPGEFNRYFLDTGNYIAELTPQAGGDVSCVEGELITVVSVHAVATE